MRHLLFCHTTWRGSGHRCEDCTALALIVAAVKTGSRWCQNRGLWVTGPLSCVCGFTVALGEGGRSEVDAQRASATQTHSHKNASAEEWSRPNLSQEKDRERNLGGEINYSHVNSPHYDLQSGLQTALMRCRCRVKTLLVFSLLSCPPHAGKTRRRAAGARRQMCQVIPADRLGIKEQRVQRRKCACLWMCVRPVRTGGSPELICSHMLHLFTLVMQLSTFLTLQLKPLPSVSRINIPSLAHSTLILFSIPLVDVNEYLIIPDWGFILSPAAD